ncbi:YicC/YloC family endoribonuclease [Peptoniphilus duerdenii]|uniref:TIGR00255 family protein n=1 Tax=Peptoniphilus duerdenii ATCC BAA-1640 TaxID=862517 RepID=E0NP26_9FIRM|nr:YicC/YloC family endoribonuclease [Peptoniphilus duerdenii]EFM24494.1 TIGR00255 family protein [Peptoniphilus duerdenii ATCC BAA-1640]
MKSMTGYGMALVKSENYMTKVEVKSVNSRYLELNLRVPKDFMSIEDKIRQEVKSKLKRGKVDLYLSYDVQNPDLQELSINKDLAKAYYRDMEDLRNTLEIEEKITLKDIVFLEGVLKKSSTNETDKELLNQVLQTVRVAVENLDEMRIAEGENLKEDLKTKVVNIEEIVEEIKLLSPKVIEENEKKLTENIYERLKEEDLDLPRLTTELAIMADKLSIDEEITRLTSHISQFNDIIKDTDSVGRKIDFLLQEFNREANTIGSKTTSSEILKLVVNLKSEIEKLREQIQNIE